MNVNVNDIKVTPDNALLMWELAVLQALQTYPDLASKPVEYYLLGRTELQERGIRPVQKGSQRQAIEAMIAKGEILARPLYAPAYLRDGTEYDNKTKPPIGYKITAFTGLDEIRKLVEQKVATINGKSIVKVSFDVNDATATININDYALTKNVGSWQGDIIAALADGGGVIPVSSIREGEAFRENYKQQVKNNAGKLNKEIKKHTGLSQFLVRGNVVKINEDLHHIELEKSVKKVQ